MQTVTRLVEPAKLKARASVGEYQEGQAIVASGGVMLESVSPLRVIAKVTSTGGPVQHADLASTPGGLYWACTCNTQHAFCAHVVAAALVITQKMPRKHRNPKSHGQPVV